MIRIEDVADLLEDMMEDENDNVSKQFKLIENEVLGNSSIMNLAKKEEIASFIMLGEVEDEDINQLLKNMSNELALDSEEKEIVMSMSRNFLKTMLMIKWLERLDE